MSDDEAMLRDSAVLAAYRFVTALTMQADSRSGGYPLWHGWALREAFLAGIAWERERQRKAPRKEL